MEDGIFAARCQKNPFSILHSPSSLFVFPGACPFHCGLHAVRSTRVAQGQKTSGTRRLRRGGGAIENGHDLLATNAQAWNYLGVACQHAGQTDDAVAAYQRALALDRDLMEAHYNLGCLWLEQNKPDAAESEFTAYTLRRRKAPEGWLKLGLAQLAIAQRRRGGKKFQHRALPQPQQRRSLEWFWIGPH